MGTHEVLQSEYVAVTGLNPSHFESTPPRPVEKVSWYNATNYCGRLTARDRADGRITATWEYRLPTEAEWEYAARAGTTNRFSFGEDPGYWLMRDYAWYCANSMGSTYAGELKRPNQWGLYDMGGNVREWCRDWYEPYPGGSVIDPQGPTTGLARVLRGGSWYHTPDYCRSGHRDSYHPSLPSNTVGFRVVLAPFR